VIHRPPTTLKRPPVGPGPARPANAARGRALPVAAVAVLLGSFVAGLATGLAGPASGGPREARERWKEAQAARGGPWRERAALYRAVRIEASDADPIGARAAEAEAKALREGGHVEGAAAASALAAHRGAARDPDRLTRAVGAGRERLEEGDLAAARAYFEDVVAHGGAAAPAPTSSALVLLAHGALAAGDADALRRHAARAADLLPRAFDVRLQIADYVGLERLLAGDEPAARRAWAEERRLYEEGRRAGAESERAVERVWIALELPRRLPSKRRGRGPRRRVRSRRVASRGVASRGLSCGWLPSRPISIHGREIGPSARMPP
jgi:hypothetical protein